ncbi:MAG: cobalamin-dependent protein [Lachnospiraceae bacterium]|nr:cobalamin-dependent protein [Candidatus Equihabitans merdae]
MEEILKRIGDLVAEGEDDDAVEATREALEMGIDPMVILNDGANAGMEIISEQYNEGEAFLPELVLAGDAMSAVIEVLFENMDAEQAAASKIGTIVMGQAKGDVHDIGKNVCAALLAVNGFEVHDLGTDVTPKALVEEAEKVNADIILCGTLLTTSLPYLADVKQYVQDTGNGDKIFVGVGGGPVTPEFAKNMKADGWSRTSFDCVEMCKKLVGECKPNAQEMVYVNSEDR